VAAFGEDAAGFLIDHLRVDPRQLSEGSPRWGGQCSADTPPSPSILHSGDGQRAARSVRQYENSHVREKGFRGLTRRDWHTLTHRSPAQAEITPNVGRYISPLASLAYVDAS
jgi:hypothetical protein